MTNFLTEELQRFIVEHAGDDALQLLMHASRYGGINVRLAAGQIEARRRIQDKVPAWRACEQIFYPSARAVEQCSSETAALYKQRLIHNDDVLCDMTGGLGVDSFFFSQKARRVIYVETDGAYCAAARHNLRLLGGANIKVVNDDATEMLRRNDPRLTDVSVFYIDPARRNAEGKRLYALRDCEPDLTAVWPLLRERGVRIIAKLSPMLDTGMALSQLSNVSHIHVVSIKNDCKEILVTAKEGRRISVSDKAGDAPEICCVNYNSSGEEQLFSFRQADEQAATVLFARQMKRYLYEPNASLMKAGAYKTAALRFGIEKLHPNSHLYTSDNYIPLFPGRIFEITDVIPFNNRACRNLSGAIPQAHIAVRNFSLSADELRRRAHIGDGGDVYLFATTLSDGKKALAVCRKASMNCKENVSSIHVKPQFGS